MGIEAIGSIGSAMGSVASAAGRGTAPVASFGGVRGGGFAHLEPAGISVLPDVGGRAVSISGFKGAKLTAPIEPIVFVPQVLPEINLPVKTEVPEAFRRAFGNEPDYALDPVKAEKQATWLAGATQLHNNNLYDLVERRLVRSSIATLRGTIVSPALGPGTKAEHVLGLQPLLQSKAAPKTESFNQTEHAQLTQPKLEEQEIEEVITEIEVKQGQKETMVEEEEAERKIYLEDEEVSAQRRQEIREAIIKARTEADRLGLKKITGWLVAKFLPAEHEGNRSQVVKKAGPDGSYQETVEAIAGIGELESAESAVRRFDGFVAEKKPVKRGKEGTPVEDKDVARVFKYRLVKPVGQAHQEVIKRVLKKKMLVSQPATALSVAGEKKEIKTESSLEELNPFLPEVFQKAA
ncbi:hypothetical protein HYU95_02595 [Candidatus Daviesbacteria bacterium]|nr:hypothetical protein [Candidatus Daviesbacteria bacterium]